MRTSKNQETAYAKAKKVSITFMFIPSVLMY